MDFVRSLPVIKKGFRSRFLVMTNGFRSLFHRHKEYISITLSI